MPSVRIGNASAFWGDRIDAAYQLALQQPNLDYITLDYLAEVSLSIMAVQKEKDPKMGYAQDFLTVISSLAKLWKEGSKIKIVTNAGGLNPLGCAKACADLLHISKCPSLKIAVISGDNVLQKVKNNPDLPKFCHLDTKQELSFILHNLVTANAYLGGKPIAEALTSGADIVITGRTADPSLTVGPAAAHFGWKWDDYNRLAGATIAGHLIECGTQVTGGISTDWLKLDDPANIGYPFVEISEDGSFVITKPSGTSGKVDEFTVKEQLLYEISDPASYLSPDATVSFLQLQLKNLGKDRIHISGAEGKSPPKDYKVSATYRAGFRAEGMLAIFGKDAEIKARKSGEIILQRLSRAGFKPERSIVECLGTGDVVPGIFPQRTSLECILRIAVADARKEVVERFTKEIAPLVTCGPQGTTGYISGRPHVRPIFGYWPCLIPRDAVIPQIDYLTEGRQGP
jgi:hypothetical protein